MLSTKSGEKITLCISILLALTLFFLPFLEMMPPTSLVVPLLGKFFVFTIQMVSLSIFFTIFTINIHNRTPSLYNKMPLTIKNIFLNHIARLLFVAEEKTFADSVILDQKYGEFKALQKRRCLDKSVLGMASFSNLIRFSKAAQSIKRNLCVFPKESDKEEKFKGDGLFLTHEAVMTCMNDAVNNIEVEIEIRIVKIILHKFFEFEVL